MKALKKILTAVTMGGMMAAGTAFAQDTAPVLSDDEKHTVTLVQEFQACVAGAMSSVPQDLVNQLGDSLVQQGVPPQYINQALTEYFISESINMCSQSMNVDLEELDRKYMELAQKYGPQVFAPAQP